MTRILYRHSQKSSGEKRSGLIVKLLLSLFIMFAGVSIIQATEFKLTRTPEKGNTVILTTPARIMRITRTPGIKSYAIWRNGEAYITISRLKFDENNGVKGVLPPGRYVLKTLGGSATIYLNTNYRPENINLWGRQNKMVKPLWDGNIVVLCAPTTIVSATYDGTEGMGIFSGSNRVLYFVSPHNRYNPGPRVIGGTGGKTLVGQILPPGVYRLVPGRGTADGIVSGQIVLNVK
jgi:hypothetical protein